MEYVQAYLDNPNITWTKAQKELKPYEVTIFNQLAVMKNDRKEQLATMHKNDYKSANKAWSKLAKNNPDNAPDVKRAQRLAQIKMLYGRDALSMEQKRRVNKFLEQIVADGESFGQYWGY